MLPPSICVKSYAVLLRLSAITPNSHLSSYLILFSPAYRFLHCIFYIYFLTLSFFWSSIHSEPWLNVIYDVRFSFSYYTNRPFLTQLILYILNYLLHFIFIRNIFPLYSLYCFIMTLFNLLLLYSQIRILLGCSSFPDRLFVFSSSKSVVFSSSSELLQRTSEFFYFMIFFFAIAFRSIFSEES